MDGLTKYTSLLSKTASIICELKTPVFDVQELPFKVVGGVCEYAFEGDIYEYADAHNIKIVTPCISLFQVNRPT